jgi:uncharacterized damage-inducible protein DinB
MRCQIRPEKLESFGRAPDALFNALRQFPKKMWLFEPAPSRWSIHKTILHLADTEVSTYMCCRRYIVEQGSLDSQFDSARWAETLGYCHQSTREALEIIRRLRKTMYRLLITLQEAARVVTAESPGEGVMSLDDWLEHHECHILHHIGQMRQNYEIWLRTQPPRKPASVLMRSNQIPPTIRRPPLAIEIQVRGTQVIAKKIE